MTLLVMSRDNSHNTKCYFKFIAFINCKKWLTEHYQYDQDDQFVICRENFAFSQGSRYLNRNLCYSSFPCSLHLNFCNASSIISSLIILVWYNNEIDEMLIDSRTYFTWYLYSLSDLFVNHAKHCKLLPTPSNFNFTDTSFAIYLTVVLLLIPRLKR